MKKEVVTNFEVLSPPSHIALGLKTKILPFRCGNYFDQYTKHSLNRLLKSNSLTNIKLTYKILPRIILPQERIPYQFKLWEKHSELCPMKSLSE
jgi:hypothetical protein